MKYVVTYHLTAEEMKDLSAAIQTLYFNASCANPQLHAFMREFSDKLLNGSTITIELQPPEQI